MKSLYARNKLELERQDKREASVGSVLGALFVVGVLSFVVWHCWRVSQWLG
jgi:hypothetical protein